MANYAVIGLEKFGYFVTRSLSERGERVLAIGFDETSVDRVRPFVETAMIVDSGNPGVLRELGFQKMDVVLVCLNEKFVESVIITHILTECRVPKIICLATSENQEKILQKIGATEVIFPERLAAFSLVQALLKTAS